METQHFTVLINAPKEKVWDAMLADETYRQWTAAFMPGSYYIGNWEKGSKIQFVAKDESGKVSGMSSEIADSRPYEFVSIHHLGVVADGVEDITSPQALQWRGYENYTLHEQDGKTELIIDVDVNEEMAAYMKDAWPKGLQKLKEIAEG